MKQKSFTYLQLLDSLKEKGCAICNTVQKSVYHYLDNFLYENINSVKLRLMLRENLGFCRKHSIQLKDMRDSLGISILYEDILEETLNQIDKFIKKVRGPTTVPPQKKKKKYKIK